MSKNEYSLRAPASISLLFPAATSLYLLLMMPMFGGIVVPMLKGLAQVDTLPLPVTIICVTALALMLLQAILMLVFGARILLGKFGRGLFVLALFSFLCSALLNLASVAALWMCKGLFAELFSQILDLPGLDVLYQIGSNFSMTILLLSTLINTAVTVFDLVCIGCLTKKGAAPSKMAKVWYLPAILTGVQTVCSTIFSIIYNLQVLSQVNPGNLDPGANFSVQISGGLSGFGSVAVSVLLTLAFYSWLKVRHLQQFEAPPAPPFSPARFAPAPNIPVPPASPVPPVPPVPPAPNAAVPEEPVHEPDEIR